MKKKHKLDANNITNDDKSTLHDAMTKNTTFSSIVNTSYKCIYFIKDYDIKLLDLINIDKAEKPIHVTVLLCKTTSMILPISERIDAAKVILDQVNKIDWRKHRRGDTNALGEIYHNIISFNPYIGLYNFTPESLLKRINETNVDGDSAAQITIRKIKISMDLTIK